MIRRLHIFDFDGTLFDSPGPPPGVSAAHMWWDDPASLEPPCVPERPPGSWYLNPAKSGFRRAVADPEGYTVVITGRLERLRSRVAGLLRNGGLKPGELFLRPGGPTVPYKIGMMRYLAKMLRTIREVEVWEDNHDNLRHLERAANKMGFAFKGHPLKHSTKPATCPNPSRVAGRFLRPPTRAGFFFIKDGTWVPVLLRAQNLNEPGTWGLPGGHIEPGETAPQAAVRECAEEIGYVPPHAVKHLDVYDGYATFFANVNEVVPVLNKEHDAWRWLNLHQVSPDTLRDLHPAMPRLVNIARSL